MAAADFNQEESLARPSSMSQHKACWQNAALERRCALLPPLHVYSANAGPGLVLRTLGMGLVAALWG